MAEFCLKNNCSSSGWKVVVALSEAIATTPVSGVFAVASEIPNALISSPPQHHETIVGHGIAISFGIIIISTSIQHQILSSCT